MKFSSKELQLFPRNKIFRDVTLASANLVVSCDFSHSHLFDRLCLDLALGPQIHICMWWLLGALSSDEH